MKESVFLVHVFIVIKIHGFVFALGLHGNVKAGSLHPFRSDTNSAAHSVNDFIANAQAQSGTLPISIAAIV